MMMSLGTILKYLSRNVRLAASLVAGGLAALLVPVASATVTQLADQPFITTVNVAGNVALALSVEYPTATSIGNGIVPYSSAKRYYGNFDSTRCYVYNTVGPTKNGTTTGGSYFSPSTLASTTDYSCANASTLHLWSGNFLNWASMSTIDPFRWALTGGYRSIDTTSLTILEKAWSGSQAAYNESPPQQTSQVTYPNITPLPSSSWSNIWTNIHNMGQYMCFTSTGTVDGGIYANGTATGGSNGYLQWTGTGGYANGASYTASSSNWSGTLNNAAEYNSASATPSASSVQCVEVRVQVCNAAAPTGVESNCVLYPSTYYKPEGLIQKYSQQMRFASFGYLLDNAGNGNVVVRDGGVMRARMNYVGPLVPVPGSNSVTNPNSEWNSTTGVFNANPDPTDVSATIALSGCSGCSIPNSGVMNYLNMFGEHARSRGNTNAYKSGDNVSELYYTVVRYFKELGNVHEYTDLTGTNSDLALSDCVKVSADQCVDGFPVITNWYPADSSAPRGYDYPIQYSCQKNFIIGIGDDNTHADGNLPGTYSGGAYLSNANGSTYEPPIESAVSGDTTLNGATINTTSLTNWIGTQETSINGHTVSSTGPLGQTALQSYISCCGGATFYLAGLAYDVHVHDMLPNAFLNADGTKSSTQTVSTYWVDVLEYGKFYNQNQYWMATKYGGFTVPGGYTEFTTATVGGTAWPTSIWASNGRTVSNTVSGVTTNYTVPDNYYSGRDSAAMVTGLSNAFSAISSSIAATTTALSISTPQLVSTNNAAYSVSYDSTTWTSQLIGSSLSYDAYGNPTTATVWNGLSNLDAQVTAGGYASGSRNIATWNDSTKAGVAFVSTALSAAEQLNLTPPSTGITAATAVNYLRGDRSNEGTSGLGLFRTRASPGLLGDIVGSRAIAVPPPSGSIQNQHNLGYAAFESQWAGRKTVVYAGANDGMLHAFNGSISSSDPTAGKELWAYVPGSLYAGPTGTPYVNGLVSRTYKTFTHYYMVNASPVIQDVDFNNAAGTFSSTSSDWHTILVGGLGKGGMSFYAIDVTDPSVMTSDTAVAGKVLWEFNQSTITGYGSTATIGYSFGPPAIVKTAKYGWVVILTSGYDNADGIGYFFMVNPKTGALLEPPISTGTGSASSPSGLTFASAYINDSTDGTADAIYAGDLYGNVWRVDLTPKTGNYAAPYKIAQVVDPVAGNPQAITTRPVIAISATTAKRYVVFGTGKTLSSSDLFSTQQNTIYSIYDGTGDSGGFFTSTSPTLPSGVTYPIVRGELQAVTNLVTGVPSNTTKKMGWYIDLAAATSTLPAEQVDVTPTEDNGIAAFGINLSNGSACSPSGSGRIDAFSVGTGVTALTDSSGNAAGTYQLGNRIVDVTFVNVNGSSIDLTVGTTGVNAGGGGGGGGGAGNTCQLCNATGNFTSSNSPTKLNWREVKGAN
jgi:type IV pilus assembly protein PilY1